MGAGIREKCTHEPGAPTAFALPEAYGSPKSGDGSREARLREANAPGLRVQNNEAPPIPFGPICVVNHRKGELQILALALALFPAHHMGRGIGV